MNAIAPVAMGFGEMERLAVSIAKSNMFGMKTPEQALVLMAISQAEGRHPALAARDYDIIQNRPAKKAEAMHRDFLAGGGKVEWHTLSDTVADATFSHPSGGTVRISWDMNRAAQAGLAKKENYRLYPRQMLRNRLISEGVRTVWPTATSGLHVPEEVRDFAGTTLDHEPTVETKVEEPPAPTERDRINAATPMNGTPKRERSPDDLLTGLELAMRDCPDLDAVNKLIANRHVQDMLRDYKGVHRARLDGIIAHGIGAHGPAVSEEQQAARDQQADAAWPGLAPEMETAEP
jgi:hypothetical protein